MKIYRLGLLNVLIFFFIVFLVSLFFIVKYKLIEYMDVVEIKDFVLKMFNVFLFLFVIGIVVYELINIIIDL